jgi:NTP pyrophosphatase (non-canonical NTP hydrolase)
MNIIEVNEKINTIYLKKKIKSFIGVDDLNQEMEDLLMQRMTLVMESGIDGSDALREMIQMKKNQVKYAWTQEQKDRYELLSAVRKNHVKYLYDNNLVFKK